MNFKKNTSKASKNRRSFIRSMSLFVAGINLPIPSLSFLNAGNTSGKKSTAKNSAPENSAVQLPEGITAVWDMRKAFHNTTPTRERICINGLWLWQPSLKQEAGPSEEWGYFKVPGPWQITSDYNQKNSQTIFPHPAWKDISPSGVVTAWYQREINIPEEWSGRRIILEVEYLNSFATIFVDGKNAGVIRFPAGEADLTRFCSPGSKHVLSLQVTALPLKDVLLSFNDTNAVYQVKGSVARRGLCGDVHLASIPAGPSVKDIRVNTSYRKAEISVNASIQDILLPASYTLIAEILDKGQKVHEFRQTFSSKDLVNGRLITTNKWKAEKLWDTNTPENQYELILSLLDDEGKLLDMSSAVRFGYRELWIDGRDFYLNGTRIFFSVMPIDNAQMQVALATYQSIRETMLRLQSIGINLVFTHNYGCQPGTHLGFTDLLRAADDTGMLLSFSQPHFGHYDWKSQGADENNGYASHAEFYVRMAQNHPSVVFYSTSHNSTGYAEDMNPDLIDGLVNRDQWNGNNARLALRAEAILKRLDPDKIVYHHSSGNLGSMHTCNFYTNWAPVQEKSDWLEHWSTKGVKPFFTCEYSDPATWDWTMYRGWYKGERAFGSAKVPWEFCIAEWNSQFLGDKAYQISEEEKKNLRWEAKQFKEGKIWGRFEYPYNLDYKLPERYPVFALATADTWRAYRTWEMSANSQWEFGNFWRLRKGLTLGYKELPVDWNNLQQPGFSPDRIDMNNSGMEYYFERTDWIPSVASEAFTRNNMPLLAYIAGKSSRFTSKDHNFNAGETFEKQIIIINNSRSTVNCECKWELKLPEAQTGNVKVTIETGQQKRIPVQFSLPANLPDGKYELQANVMFSNGETQSDLFLINVLPVVPNIKKVKKIALWDTLGETTKMAEQMGIKFHKVEAGGDLSGYDILIIGKGTLSSEGPGLKLDNVRKGLKVIVFEQKAEVLESRFGFRVQEYGLRNVFKRISDHPVLSGLNEDNLHDWRGEATIIPSRLRYELSQEFGSPTVKWCGIPVTRQWRCGTQGNLASVLIEKPARGNFLPLIDGGFSLQYSPLMEYREGKGMILFCQMDITGRTEYEPAAELLTHNIMSYVTGWKPEPVRHALYAGEKSGKIYLENAGLSSGEYSGGELSSDQVLIAGPGSGETLSANADKIKAWLKTGGHLMAAGLSEDDIRVLFPDIHMKAGEHIAAYFEPAGSKSLLSGIGSSDVHNRAPVEIPLVSSGAAIIGDGVLAKTEDANVLFYQLLPWQMDYSNGQHNVKQSFRRSAFLLNRLLGNMGISGSTKILARFNSPVMKENPEKRWLDDLYMDEPEDWDDPYRFFRW
jgi:beta-galactosidase/beta-glucuronidase